MSGSARENATIAYRFEFPPGVGLKATATVLRAQPERELRWAAHFVSGSLFNGEHYFVIRPTSESHFMFHHGEIFSGALLPVVLPVLQRSAPPTDREMTAAFKEHVEGLL